MEGLSQEAISLAGTLRLRKLIALYDDNGISIDGAVAGWFTDDTPARFRACGWNVIGPLDGHDPVALDVALRRAQWNSQAEGGGPTLIVCRTEIGHGVPSKAGSHEVHGAPLGAAGIKELRAQLGWTEPPFVIPDDAAQGWDARERGVALQSEWARRFASYRNAHPELAAEFTRRMDREAPPGLAAAVDALLVGLAEQARPVATRRASQLALDAIAPLLPELFGGSADLTGSNLTDFKGHRVAGRDHAGNYLSWGVREFGMAAAMNGMALHGGLIPYGGTFLTFSDYSRNAIRMAALMNLRVIHVFSHDSIALGEDGPTHQPVEHVSALRLIPNLDVWRPADTLETAVAWAHALARSDGPSALILSRQALPVAATAAQRDQIARGGYVLAEVAPGAAAQAQIIATGSEVQLALAAQKLLAGDGIAVRVVSMPSTSVFDRQGADWRNAVLPADLPTVAVEAGHPDLWHKYVGRDGAVIGIASFGESAPAAELLAHFGFVAERVAEQVRRVVSAA
jgi:transketolase